MSNNRLQRLEAQMQKELAQLLTREVKDPRIGAITVTQVVLNPDRSVARIFVVPLGGVPTAGPNWLEGLKAASGFLRGEVGRRVQMRHAPRLEFVADDSFEKAARLEALFAEGRKSPT